MTFKDITKNILKDIAWRIYPDAANDADRDALIATIDSSIEDACDDLLDPPIESLISNAHKYIVNAVVHYATDPHYFESVASPCPEYFLYTINDAEDASYLLNINTKTSPFILTCNSFWKDGTTLADLFPDSELWDAILRIWQHILPNTQEAEKFWVQIDSPQRKDYYMAIDGETVKIADKDKSWKYFAFGYFTIVNNDKFPIPKKLEITNPNLPLKSPLTYQQYAKYDQFFDTYNVLNEIKHAGDKLTRFLKTYHVVEQFAYRAKFIKLVNASQEQDISLVRRLEALTDTFKQSETEVIVSSIETLFPNIKPSLDGQIGTPDDVLSADCRKFLKEKYKIYEEPGGVTYSAKAVGQMIYNLRNSIVHNKETEFHLTYNNISEYECIISLMDFLTNQLIKGIIDLIEKHRRNKVLYKKKTLKLY